MIATPEKFDEFSIKNANLLVLHLNFAVCCCTTTPQTSTIERIQTWEEWELKWILQWKGLDDDDDDDDDEKDQTSTERTYEGRGGNSNLD